MTIRIGNKSIARDADPFVIAEVGINHNGSLEQAIEMVRTARVCGCDAVKFQTFVASEMVEDPALTYTYRSQGREVTESMVEMFRRAELAPEEWRRLKDACDSEGIPFLSTPQNRTDLDLLLPLGIEAIKIGSDDFTNLPLIESYAETKLPLILSCGMADLAEVHSSLRASGALDGHPVVLLLCTSQYPTPPADVNLRKLETLAAAFPMVVLGFSDHTRGALAASVAVGLGARVFEKHFTLSHDLPGPDHWFSEDPAGLKEWVESIRTSHRMLGSALVEPTVAERDMRRLARRSIVALRDIEAGAVIAADAVGLRRPGTGLPAAMLDQVVGTRALRAIRRGAQLALGDFAAG